MSLVADRVSVRLGSRSVLEGIDLAVKPGEILAVLGPNGAGKTTLMRTLAGLLAPASGRVLLDGDDLSRVDRRRLGRRLAFLPQERTVHWPIAARIVVALGRRPHGGALDRLSAADAVAVERALAAVDAQALADRPVDELSGGERARVLIARALAQEAGILIADEPLAGLDPAHQLELARQLQAIAREGRSVVLALHDLSLAARFASRVAIVKDGRLMAVGAPGDALNEDIMARAFGIRASIATIGGVPVVVPVAAAR